MYSARSHGWAHRLAVRPLQLVTLERSPLSSAVKHIPEKPFELDPDWEVDPESLTIMEKIGVFQDPDLHLICAGACRS